MWLGRALAPAVLLAAPALAAHDVLRPERDDITQLVLEDCPNLVQAQFSNGKRQWSFQVCGLIALYEKLEDYAAKPEQVKIRDYASLAEARRIEAASGDSTFRLQPRFIKASSAWYLYDAAGDKTLSQPPHIYAFKTKDAAKKVQTELGGKLLDWAEASRRAKQAAADWDRHAGHEVETQGRPTRSSD
jgi:hypothetical protein